MKEGTPSKLPPEFATTSLLPPLKAGQTSRASIGDEARCFSFLCCDCMPRLALDYYNHDYLDKLSIVPSLASVAGNHERGLFDNHTVKLARSLGIKMKLLIFTVPISNRLKDSKEMQLMGLGALK